MVHVTIVLENSPSESVRNVGTVGDIIDSKEHLKQNTGIIKIQDLKVKLFLKSEEQICSSKILTQAYSRLTKYVVKF